MPENCSGTIPGTFFGILDSELKLGQLWKTIAQQYDSGIIDISVDGWRIKGIDPTHVCILDVFIAAKEFSEFHFTPKLGEPMLPIQVNFADLQRAFTPFGKTEKSVKIYYDSPKELQFEVQRIVFSVKLPTAIARDEIRIADNIPTDCILTVTNLKDLQKFLKFAKTYTDYILFSADPTDPAILLKGSGDMGDCQFRLPGTNFSLTNPCSSLYSLEFLTEVFGVPLKTIRIAFATDKPLQVQYSLSARSYLRYVMAPRCESNEDEEELAEESEPEEEKESAEENLPEKPIEPPKELAPTETSPPATESLPAPASPSPPQTPVSAHVETP